MGVNGNNIFIATGTNATPIAGTRSNEVTVGCETIEISNPTQGSWRQSLAGRKEWSVTVSWLVTANADVQKLLDVGSSYTLKFRSTDTAYLTGTAILTLCKITATRGNLMQGTFQFNGNGALASE